jgi:putative alpha-1,2-mannosidase
MVPHDVPDLVGLLGGEAAFVAKLEEMLQAGRENFRFELPNGYYFHGNEPDIVAPWLFAFGGRQDLTTTWVAWVADTAYALDSGGLVGNDDGGTLSSWYVFAAAGIYPLPCTGEYALAAPLFDEVVLHLAGADLTVRRGADPDAPATLDGAVLDGPTVTHAAIAGGGVLVLAPPKPLADRAPAP